ncbi:MAG: hypothetical protein QOD52_1614 [Gaiellaceae bacterium]|nr:hypothetical protein [Gaiellaceae bacterium]
MRRADIEHVVRAAADIVNDEIVVIGSQAIVVQFDDLPDSLLVSMEADVFPLRAPERAIEIDGALGDGSDFHDQFGFYGHGVGPETPRAPAGWLDRSKRVVFTPYGGWKNEAVGHFMEAHDLVLSKLVAGRPKDFDYAEVALRNDLIDVDELRRGLDLMENADRELARRNLELLIARLP